jgi:hypothetical protein
LEAARTRSLVNTNPANPATTPGLIGHIGVAQGNAWRLEGTHESGRFSSRILFGRSDPTFNNAAAPLHGGRGEAQIKVNYGLTDNIRLSAEGLSSQDRNTGGGTRKAAQLAANVKWSERLTLEVGLRTIRESDGTVQPNWPTPFAATGGLTGSIATGSGGGAVGYGNQLLDPASGMPIINAGSTVPTTGGIANPSSLSSNTVRLGVGYQATERVSLGGEVEREFSGQAQRRVALGADMRIAERSRVYSRYERRTGFTSPFALTAGTPAAAERQSNTFVVGMDTSYWSNAQLYSEYRLRDVVSSRDLQWANGARNQWQWDEDLRFSAAFEKVSTLDGNAPGTWAVAGGVEYSGSELWRASTRVELRHSGDVGSTQGNDTFNTVLLQSTLARKLDRDWTALARNHLLRTRYAAKGEVLQDRFQIGAAYRDTDRNRVNALARYEFRTERDASGAEPLRFKSHMLTTHADWHPSRPVWLSGRVAALQRTDLIEGGINDSFKGVMVSGRSLWDISKRWDMGVQMSIMAGQQGQRQRALGLETGYLMQENLWLSAGYNVAGFSADRQLEGYAYTRPGAYIRLRFKFDEDLFKGGAAAVNRSMDR